MPPVKISTYGKKRTFRILSHRRQSSSWQDLLQYAKASQPNETMLEKENQLLQPHERQRPLKATDAVGATDSRYQSNVFDYTLSESDSVTHSIPPKIKSRLYQRPPSKKAPGATSASMPPTSALSLAATQVEPIDKQAPADSFDSQRDHFEELDPVEEPVSLVCPEPVEPVIVPESAHSLESMTESEESELEAHSPAKGPDASEVSDKLLAVAFSTLDLSQKPSVSAWSEPLLQCCEQQVTIGFDSFMEELRSHYTIEKIGESTYSEVFQCTSSQPKATLAAESIVLKVIPIRPALTEAEGFQQSAEMPWMSRPMDVVHEVLMTKKLSPTSSSYWNGYIQLYGSAFVCGTYPRVLVDAWNQYDAAYGADNASPELFSQDQTYVVLLLHYGGTDIEHLELTRVSQAFSIIKQVCIAVLWAQEVSQPSLLKRHPRLF